MVKHCDFEATRTKARCQNTGTTVYGKKAYCSEHFRTQQAQNARRDYEAAVEAEEAAAFAASPLPPTVVGGSKSGTKLPAPTPPKEYKTKLPTPKKNVVKVHKNKWGRYEDSTTHFVFDRLDNKVYGKQDQARNRILPLSLSDKKLCEKNGWKTKTYEQPVEEESEEESEDERSEDEQSDERSEEYEEDDQSDDQSEESEEESEDEQSDEGSEDEDEQSDEGSEQSDKNNNKK